MQLHIVHLENEMFLVIRRKYLGWWTWIDLGILQVISWPFPFKLRRPGNTLNFHFHLIIYTYSFTGKTIKIKLNYFELE